MNYHHKTTSPKNVIVVGAGMGGLASAARLAKRGHRVSIYEATAELGGKCRTETIDGYKFDIGPSLLTLPAVYRDLFLKTGKRIEHVLQLNPVDPAFTYVFDDGKKVIFPNLSHHGTVQSITEVFGEDAGRQWHQLLTRAEAMWDASREDFIESELRSLATFFKRKTLSRDIKTIAPLKSLRQLFNEYSDNPYLRKIVDRYATYTGSDPRKVPAVLLTIAFVEEAFGAWHIAGGLGNLATELAQRCRDLGVTVHTNSRVSGIRTEGRRAVGITLADGQSRDADVIVVNADVEHLYGSLLPKSRFTRKPQRALRSSTPSLSGFTIQLGLRGKSDLGHHTVLFPSDYDDEFDAIFNRKQPVPDPAIYICNPRDELMTPSPNHESWFILINAPRHEPESGFDWSDKRFAEQYAGKIIDRIEARGIKVRERIEVMKIRTPADFEREVLAPAGSIYGTSSNGARSAFLRAKNRSPIQNLFCVGGSAHPGGGLPLVGISAEIVANAIEGR